MKNIEQVCFIIQARKDSTRIKNKMLRPFADSSLIEIAIKKIKQSKTIPSKNLYLSVRDKEFLELAKKYDINVFYRSSDSIEEPITLDKVFEWFKPMKAAGFKYYVILNACNPILRIKTIESFVERFLESPKDGLFGVIKKQTFIYDKCGNILNKFLGKPEYLTVLETKFVDPCYEAAHSLYAGSLEDLENGIYMGEFKNGSPEFFLIPEREAFDIDWPEQFEFAENIYTSFCLSKEHTTENE